MLDIGVPRLSMMAWSFLQDLSRAVPRFSRGPVAGNHRQHFFDPTGSDIILEKNVFFGPIGDYDAVGSKKC